MAVMGNPSFWCNLRMWSETGRCESQKVLPLTPRKKQKRKTREGKNNTRKTQPLQDPDIVSVPNIQGERGFKTCWVFMENIGDGWGAGEFCLANRNCSCSAILCDRNASGGVFDITPCKIKKLFCHISWWKSSDCQQHRRLHPLQRRPICYIIMRGKV